MVTEALIRQYRSLSRLFKKYSTQEILCGEYSHLRKHKTKERIEDNFLDSKFKIAMLARPPFIEGRGRKTSGDYDCPGKTEILLYVHGTMKDSSDFNKGFLLDGNPFRTTVRDPIATQYPFHIALIGSLSGSYNSGWPEELLEEGNYEEFVRNMLVITDSTIDKFKRALERTIT